MKKRAFTLVELLVVISIMGVLMAIVVGNFQTTREKARDAQRVSDLKRIQLSLGLYFSVNTSRQYPVSSALSSTLVNSGFIDRIPTDPLTNESYSYVATGSSGCTGYYLSANLETAGSNFLKDSATIDPTISSCTSETASLPVSSEKLYLVTPNN